MFVTLIDTRFLSLCHFVTLISIKPATVLSTSGDNFREENGKKKLVRGVSAESIYRCMLLLLDHVRYHGAHCAALAINML